MSSTITQLTSIVSSNIATTDELPIYDVSAATTKKTTVADVVAAAGYGVGQIVFPAIQNASANVNTLDDYEEQTWTPSITFGGAAVGLTGVFTGKYTKVGRLVFAWFQIALTSKGSSVGSMAITGLPFVPDVSGLLPAPLVSMDWQSLNTAVIALCGSITSSNISLQKITGATVNNRGLSVVDTDVTNDTNLAGLTIYFTT